MLYANVDGEKSRAQPSQRGICPYCDGEVIAKCGDVRIWHWAHRSGSEGCYWAEETDWHLQWKSNFPKEYVEIPIERDGIKHRADVLLPNGFVLEFQHSSMNWLEIYSREEFYGDKLIWVVDLQDQVDRMNFRYHERYYGYSYKRPKQMVRYFTKKTVWDIGQVFAPRSIYEHPRYLSGSGQLYPRQSFINLLVSWGLKRVRLTPSLAVK